MSSSSSSSHQIVKPKPIRCHPLPIEGKLSWKDRVQLNFISIVLVDFARCDYATLLRAAKVSNSTDNNVNSLSVAHDKKRTRILFTSWQVAELERLFAEQKYVSAQERLAISMRIGLSPTQIKIWFQNRRYKSKKTNTIFLRTTWECRLWIWIAAIVQPNDGQELVERSILRVNWNSIQMFSYSFSYEFDLVLFDQRE